MKRKKDKCLRHHKGMKGIQYGSFYKSQSLPSNITAKSDWVPDVIRNKIIRIPNEGTSVTECDLGAQLRGVTQWLLNAKSFKVKSNATEKSHGSYIEF